MKYVIYLFVLLAYSSFQAQAQPKYPLVNWTFEGSSNLPTNVDPRIDATPAIFSVGSSVYASPGADSNYPQSFTTVYAPSPMGASSYNLDAQADPNGGQTYATNGWTSANAPDPNQYLEFTISSNSLSPNDALQVTEIHFDHLAEVGGPRSFSVVAITNYNGSPARIAFGSGSTTTAWQRSISSGAYQEIFRVTDQPITFRIYGYDAPNPGAFWKIDNIVLIGNSNACTSCQPMPVQFTYFEGQSLGQQTQLRWQTSWEHNTSHFVVERSENATEFGLVGQVKAMGESTAKQTYGFIDPSPLSGVGYYRLRQVDQDGSVQFSRILAVKADPDQPALRVLGNPATSQRINLSLNKVDPSSLLLTDMAGRPLGFRVVAGSQNQTTLEPTAELPPGVYLLQAASWGTVRVVIH